ncbi:MAG: sulfatase-like hydrolase/transferase [Acidobacteria bacterium]|nr:sulfatase-like hydrolase/transferase [Acidobacteriota bacterium]
MPPPSSGLGELGTRAVSPGLWKFLLILTSLYALAVAQPIFQMLSAYPEFFVIRGLGPLGVVLFAFACVLLPPLPFLLLRLAVQKLGSGFRIWVERVFLAIPIALFVLYAVGREMRILIAGWTLPVIALAVGLVAIEIALRAEVLKSFLLFLSPACLILPVLFLVDNPILLPPAAGGDRLAALGAREEISPAEIPVILVVFDEFSLQSLLDGNQDIDRHRFPGFSSLAEISTWYRDTLAASQRTISAVPAILTGKYPEPDQLPNAGSHPDNLFSAIGPGRLRVAGEIRTRLCPVGCTSPVPELLEQGNVLLAEDLGIAYLHLVTPQPFLKRLPAIDRDWGGFAGRIQRDSTSYHGRFEAFMSTIRSDNGAAFYFEHSHLPHRPHEYSPSGFDYLGFGPDPQELRQEHPTAMEQNYRRYLVQVEHVDRLVAELLAHLRETGTLDPSLLIVTADHGPRYLKVPGVAHDGRTSAAEWMRVPLFVKMPGQTSGVIDDRPASSVDVAPTILEALGILDQLKEKRGWGFDGLPLSQVGPDRQRATCFGDERIRIPQNLEADFDAVLKWKLETFGDGSSPEALYQRGSPRPDLIGVPRDELPRAEFDGELLIDGSDDNTDRVVFEPASGRAPLLVAGKILHSRDEPTEEAPNIAILVDGTTRATARTYPLVNGERQFEVLLPEDALRVGENFIEALPVP